LRREGRVYSGEPVVTTLVCFIYFAREAAGALATRLSLRPLFIEARTVLANLGRIAPRECGGASGIPRHCEEPSDATRHCERSEAIHFAA
jgi:hypothetical protein